MADGLAVPDFTISQAEALALSGRLAAAFPISVERGKLIAEALMKESSLEDCRKAVESIIRLDSEPPTVYRIVAAIKAIRTARDRLFTEPEELSPEEQAAADEARNKVLASWRAKHPATFGSDEERLRAIAGAVLAESSESDPKAPDHPSGSRKDWNLCDGVGKVPIRRGNKLYCPGCEEEIR